MGSSWTSTKQPIANSHRIAKSTVKINAKDSPGPGKLRSMVPHDRFSANCKRISESMSNVRRHIKKINLGSQRMS